MPHFLPHSRFHHPFCHSKSLLGRVSPAVFRFRNVDSAAKSRQWETHALRTDRDDGRLVKSKLPQSTDYSIADNPVLPGRSIGDIDFWQNVYSWRNGEMADDAVYHITREAEVGNLRVYPSNPLPHIRNPRRISWRDPMLITKFQTLQGATNEHLHTGLPTDHWVQVRKAGRQLRDLGLLTSGTNRFFSHHQKAKLRMQKDINVTAPFSGLGRSSARDVARHYFSLVRTLNHTRQRRKWYIQMNQQLFDQAKKRPSSAADDELKNFAPNVAPGINRQPVSVPAVSPTNLTIARLFGAVSASFIAGPSWEVPAIPPNATQQAFGVYDHYGQNENIRFPKTRLVDIVEPSSLP